MDLKHINKSILLLIFATLGLLLHAYMTHEPLTLEQRQDYYELAKNKECPNVPSEEHCRQYYNDIIINLK